MTAKYSTFLSVQQIPPLSLHSDIIVVSIGGAVEDKERTTQLQVLQLTELHKRHT